MNEIDKLEQAFEKRRKRDGSLEQEINDQYIRNIIGNIMRIL